MYQKEIAAALFIVAVLGLALISYMELKRIDDLMSGKRSKKKGY